MYKYLSVMEQGWDALLSGMAMGLEKWPGARPNNDISIEFEIRPNFYVL